MLAGNQDLINFVGAQSSIFCHFHNFSIFFVTYAYAIRPHGNSALSQHSIGTIFNYLRILAVEIQAILLVYPPRF